MSFDDTDQTRAARLDQIYFKKLVEELKTLADGQELMRRDLNDLRVAFVEFRGESKGKGESADGLVKRVEKLEAFVDDLRMFKVKVAAYGVLGGTVFGALAAGIVNLFLKAKV